MAKLAAHQKPWLHRIAYELKEEDLVGSERAAEIENSVGNVPKTLPVESLFILCGGDHGYWREERIVYTTVGEIFCFIDSHRSVFPEWKKLENKLEQYKKFYEECERIVQENEPQRTILLYPKEKKGIAWGFCLFWISSGRVVGYVGFRGLYEIFWEIWGRSEKLVLI